MKIGIANDHAGYTKKSVLLDYLKSEGIEIVNFGTDSDASCDYADFAHPMAVAVEKGELDYGIAICSTGNGINMTVNKHPKIRAALCWNAETARLAKNHNNANILSLPANFLSNLELLEIVSIFLNEGFEGGRHERRINKIPL